MLCISMPALSGVTSCSLVETVRNPDITWISVNSERSTDAVYETAMPGRTLSTRGQYSSLLHPGGSLQETALVYQNTWRHVTEGYILNIHCRININFTLSKPCVVKHVRDQDQQDTRSLATDTIRLIE
jgi:hypothetical protein